jgi:hypothetical protein
MDIVVINGDLLSEFLEEYREEEIRCRTGLVIGVREAEGVKKVLDLVLTPDPEIEIEEVEKNK